MTSGPIADGREKRRLAAWPCVGAPPAFLSESEWQVYQSLASAWPEADLHFTAYQPRTGEVAFGYTYEKSGTDEVCGPANLYYAIGDSDHSAAASACVASVTAHLLGIEEDIPY